MTEPIEADRELADGLAEYLAEFTYGKGHTEADCIFDALQETRRDERERITDGEPALISAKAWADKLDALTEKHRILRVLCMGVCSTLDRAAAMHVPGAADVRDALRATLGTP